MLNYMEELQISVTMFLKNQSRWKAIILDLDGTLLDKNKKISEYTKKYLTLLKNVEDKDKSIISYTYNIYLANDITLENTNPQIQYSITKNDSDPLVLNLNEIDELIKYEWERIPHFYYNFYVYKYATGLSAACYIVNNIFRNRF